MARQGRSNRRAYSRVSSSGNGGGEEEQQASASVSLHESLDPEAEALTLEQPPQLVQEDDATVATDDVDENDFITIVILDPAQSKFNVRANPDWTVEQFKNKGVSVHKVPNASQRLIFHGKMLTDDSTLRENGIAKDNVIVHLFPKPNVVVEGCDDADDDSSEAGGAHVPRIVLDPDEAERRSHILVLASDEVFEAQHRVKLMCLLLLFMSSMELLQVFTIMMGGPEDDGNDDTPPGQPTDSTHDQPQVRPWQTSDYFDLMINAFGFYVAMLGIRATTENTLQLAKVYMYGTFCVGVAWNAFYYYLNINQLTKDEESDDGNVDMPTIYTGAFFGMLLPILVWILCCLRAWQFHELLLEAEREAGERTRNESDEEQPEDDEVQHDQELVLQIEDDENRQIT